MCDIASLVCVNLVLNLETSSEPKSWICSELSNSQSVKEIQFYEPTSISLNSFSSSDEALQFWSNVKSRIKSNLCKLEIPSLM